MIGDRSFAAQHALRLDRNARNEPTAIPGKGISANTRECRTQGTRRKSAREARSQLGVIGESHGLTGASPGPAPRWVRLERSVQKAKAVHERGGMQGAKAQAVLRDGMRGAVVVPEPGDRLLAGRAGDEIQERFESHDRVIFSLPKVFLPPGRLEKPSPRNSPVGSKHVGTVLADAAGERAAM